MPAKPKFLHPLAHVRQCIAQAENRPCTQRTLADLLDVATITVKKIEQGRLAVSPSLAIAIRDATGAVVPVGITAKSMKAKDVGGRVFTSEFYQRKKGFESSKPNVPNLTGWLNIIGAAASRKRMTTALELAMREALHGVARKCKLIPEIDRILADVPNASGCMTHRAGTWRALLGIKKGVHDVSLNLLTQCKDELAFRAELAGAAMSPDLAHPLNSADIRDVTVPAHQMVTLYLKCGRRIPFEIAANQGDYAMRILKKAGKL